LIDILSQAIQVFSYLQQNQLAFGKISLKNILFDKYNLKIKLNEEFTDFEENYRSDFKYCFLKGENPYKMDVFMLGISILELALQTSCLEIYDHLTKRINVLALSQ
jgi:hypothetical protein